MCHEDSCEMEKVKLHNIQHSGVIHICQIVILSSSRKGLRMRLSDNVCLVCVRPWVHSPEPQKKK